jgi:hypothetical protein
VQNGVIVLAGDVALPEGQEVTVVASFPEGRSGHGILDIPPVSLGGMLRPIDNGDDLLGEMLEGRS